MTILPEEAIDILPFSAEPFLQWNEQTDLAQFLDALHAGTPYSSFGKKIFALGKERTQAWSQRFIDHAQKDLLLRRTDAKQDIPNFIEDATFGKATKYVIAWNESVSALLAERAFYSLAHLLESSAEIDCSLLLASHCYYKQATQILRNFIEEQILPIVFCENEQEFTKWRKNKYKLPQLRGDEGLLEKLVAKGILTSLIKKTVSDLYGDFNSYVHGNENRFIHKGLFGYSHSGVTFKYNDFCEWSEYLSRSIDIGIRLLKINYNQWERIGSSKWEHLRQQGKQMLCDVCHNEDDFDIEILPPIDVEMLSLDSTGRVIDAKPGKLSRTNYKCRQCGYQISTSTP